MRRALGAASRRLARPELLAAFDAGARQEQREAHAITGILASSLGEDSVYVDVGANRGQLLGEAVRVAPLARHVAFEPIPALMAELAGRFPAVDCRALAIGAQSGVADFCHFTSLDGWSGLRRSPHVSDEQGRPRNIRVNVSTLDAEVSALRPSVVKIDVEGAELDVLRGARSLLSDTRPVLVFEHVAEAAELYGASSTELWELLADLDYRVFSVTGEGPFARSEFARSRPIVNWLATPRAATARV